MVISAREASITFGTDKILKYLPQRIAEEVAFTESALRARLNEVRLRVNAPMSLTVGGENIIPGKSEYVTAEEIARCVENLCEGSYHAQAENIRNGYIMTSDGFRAGISGILDGDTEGIPSLGSITSINLRLGKFVHIDVSHVAELIKRSEKNAGIIVLSPPGGGKTTLLKYLAYTLSSGKGGFTRMRRVALIDSRRELYDEDNMRGGLIDLFSGYKKARAIEIAVRVMNPEFIICDEICENEEFNAVFDAKNSGVSVIASAHAGDMDSIAGRSGIGGLIKDRVFESAVFISKSGANYRYEIFGL